MGTCQRVPPTQRQAAYMGEMCAIKDMFFEPEEECVQFHPKKSSYVNIAQNCLHIWWPVDGVLYMKSPYKEEICNGNEN